jgi:hypothetical protein
MFSFDLQADALIAVPSTLPLVHPGSNSQYFPDSIAESSTPERNSARLVQQDDPKIPKIMRLLPENN